MTERVRRRQRKRPAMVTLSHHGWRWKTRLPASNLPDYIRIPFMSRVHGPGRELEILPSIRRGRPPAVGEILLARAPGWPRRPLRYICAGCFWCRPDLVMAAVCQVVHNGTRQAIREEVAGLLSRLMPVLPPPGLVEP